MKSSMRLFKTVGVAAFAMFAATAVRSAEPKDIAGASCDNPPRINCPNSNCLAALVGNQGPAVEPKSGRHFYVEFPCDLKKGEKVNLVLSLHGAGSIGNWQRHYFPLTDYKDKYRLVVITPTALTDKPTRTWQAQADDEFLHNVVDLVTADIGKQNIRSFWLAGHSQGGATGRRLVCSPYFRDKVDGFLSLSGGRIGSPDGYVRTGAGQGAPGGGAPARGATPAAGAPSAPARAAAPAALPPLDCDFSFIYSQGSLEGSVSDISTWAQKYGCGDRVREPDVVDTSAGYVTATDQTRGPGWGRFARPGTANVWDYPKCKNGRIVADVVKLDKGHTEGYEPHITEKLIQMMVAAPVLKGPHATVKTASEKPAKKSA
jgi:pimeloyl-ACP methyl ester carboxylesterase